MAGIIPIPIAESLIDCRAKLYAVKETIKKHNLTEDEEVLTVFCGDTSRKVPWLLRLVIELLINLILLPLKKVMRVLWHANVTAQDTTCSIKNAQYNM